MAKSRKPGPDEDRYFETRRQAFRAAKRDNEVPVTQQPKQVLTPPTPKGAQFELDDRNKRLYIFKRFTGLFSRKQFPDIHIREDRAASYEQDQGDQAPHFNSGPADGKLKKHHYFNRR